LQRFSASFQTFKGSRRVSGVVAITHTHTEQFYSSVCKAADTQHKHDFINGFTE